MAHPCIGFRGSVVHVEVKPKEPDEVMELWDRVDPIPITDTKGVQERLEASKKGHCGTGFVVGDDGQTISVLTCAHILGPAFNAKNPITVAQVESLFKARIICDHNEQNFRTGAGPRMYFVVHVAELNCSMDLLLVSIPKGWFMALHCQQPHPAITIAPNFPPALEEVAMLSWPPNRPRTSVSGHVSHPGRLYKDVSAGNHSGYTMRLAEVVIASDVGSSGAPLFNMAGQYAAVLQSGDGGWFSFFISFEDLRATLRAWGYCGMKCQCLGGGS